MQAFTGTRSLGSAPAAAAGSRGAQRRCMAARSASRVAGAARLRSTFTGAAPSGIGRFAGVPLVSAGLGRGPRGGTRAPTRMCGIVAVHKKTGNASVEIFEALQMLQHRGQDSAGMVTTDGTDYHQYKENGLVRDVFTKQEMAMLTGNAGIAHVRYPTAGSASALEAQPFFANSPLGIFLIHNGNLTNVQELRDSLSSSSSFFNRLLLTNSDSEVLLNVLADEIHRAHQVYIVSGGTDPNSEKVSFIKTAVERTMQLVRGAYSCLTLVNGVGIVGFRDPHGIRPLVLGRRDALDGDGDEWCLASEDCAFGPIGFERVRDIQPGEVVIITEDGELITHQGPRKELTPCIFEYIYLARPDSILNDIPVYSFQLGLGTRLAKRIQATDWDIDIVVPVPDGSRPSAIQISAELGLPYREGLVKNRYVGRTFIMPDQRTRELSVRRKLNAMSAVFEGQNVLLVDDSIVRGTTMTQIVDMVRAAGANKVYLASSAPPVKYPNVYGVDMPSKREFVADGLTEAEVCSVLGADGLLYQSVEDLLATGRELNPAIETFEASCFTCSYVSGDIDDAYLAKLEQAGRGEGRRAGRKASLVS